jgi:hypothetical protein
MRKWLGPLTAPRKRSDTKRENIEITYIWRFANHACNAFYDITVLMREELNFRRLYNFSYIYIWEIRYNDNETKVPKNAIASLTFLTTSSRYVKVDEICLN